MSFLTKFFITLFVLPAMATSPDPAHWTTDMQSTTLAQSVHPRLLALATLNHIIHQTPLLSSGRLDLQMETRRRPIRLQKIGDFDLVRFRNEVASVQWYFSRNPYSFIIPGHPHREGIVSIVETRSVFVSPGHWNRGLGMGYLVMALHESFGALGYPDDDYERSILLHRLLLKMISPNSQVMISYFNNLESKRRTTSPQHQFAGGVTGVGSAGDADGSHIKHRLFDLIPHFSRASIRMGIPSAVITEEEALQRLLRISVEIRSRGGIIRGPEDLQVRMVQRPEGRTLFMAPEAYVLNELNVYVSIFAMIFADRLAGVNIPTFARYLAEEIQRPPAPAATSPRRRSPR